jgi:hypothetical protein
MLQLKNIRLCLNTTSCKYHIVYTIKTRPSEDSNDLTENLFVVRSPFWFVGASAVGGDLVSPEITLCPRRPEKLGMMTKAYDKLLYKYKGIN